MTRYVLTTTLVFFLPSCILGMISPIVIKLALEDLATSGHVVGTVHAFSTLGAIAGSFATGFLLLSWFGTRAIIVVVGLVLIAVGLFCGAPWRSKASAGGRLSPDRG